MKTACFVDGYNFYYGLLNNTSYKWLDLRKLIEHILYIQDQSFSLVETTYFTSPIKPDLARRGVASDIAQKTYIRALKNANIEVVMGRHKLEKARAPVYVKDQKADRNNSCDIWLLEEKETDVNIALFMYRTALLESQKPPNDPSKIEQILLVSGDTDMTPALRLIRQDFPSMKIGLIFPQRENLKRTPPGSLIELADWSRKVVKEDELRQNQFPDRIPTKKKPILKPVYW
ncbi:NYN domain-containing protein [Acinetobacter baumannii]|uniref:NYN domain-containing protein n=1 Tax=Acinetobacter calcoaceticus/baumannii complex TaxID=909768 RepID=UPI0015806B22|nr:MULTISPECIES: NYN domain-containing protein [Acinetobacter calcoaceticus/baumannii complex]EKU4535664.1 NYN domain-containing protein [Acinetobacter baumannii]EKU4539677.1 NYN domain-containing protein [Acinetobacter baumannii]EKX0729602.1 NYN domain-containing protein [Acinetobacter baumannii]ELA8291240.1 NYN domain-containing protein [Acinetobacter baumannii]ELN5403006.1 NYN domain-containing protein [Acinetobacter baumannii]